MTYAPELGMDANEAARIAAPFGAGMSRMGWTCGAVSGALMVIGMRYGHEAGTDYETKERLFQLSQTFLVEFEAHHGSVVCRDLLGRDLSLPGELEQIREEGTFELLCPKLVGDAVEILETILSSGS